MGLFDAIYNFFVLGKCESCHSKLIKETSKSIDINSFENLDYYAAMQKYYKAINKGMIPDNVKIHICDSCHSKLKKIEESEQLAKVLFEQQQADIRYQERLKREVELKTLEKRAIELGIDLNSLK